MHWHKYLVLFLSIFVFGSEVRSDNKPQEIFASDIGQGTLIMGMLGKPIGQWVTIHGTKVVNGPFGDLFEVDSVDGEKTNPHATIHVSGIDKWPENTQATLYGYEIGTIRFKTKGDTNLPPDATMTPVQNVFLSFHVMQIVQPNGLQLIR